MTTEEKIALLGGALGVANDKTKKLTNEQYEVYHRIQGILLQTPGHAEYYERRIKAAQDKYFNATDDSNQGRAAVDLDNERIYGFQTLGQLPSPETVRVLGEFLFDMKGVDKNGNRLPGVARGTAPMSTRAAQALNDLPFKNRPMPYKQYLQFEHVRTWQLWYQQIKAGRRTFSFEGDPTEYDLNGPVREVKNPDTPRAAKRSPVVDEASPKPGNPTQSISLPWIAAAVAALLTGVSWIILKKRKAI